MEQIRKGLCSRCGYDMRGSPEPCPERATVVADERARAWKDRGDV